MDVLGLNSNKVKIVVFNFSHYSMDDNKGLSALVLGNHVDTNNQFGISVSEATIPNYSELNYLKTIHPNDLPAVFEADQGIISIKSNGKAKQGIAYSNLNYVAKVNMSMQPVEQKKQA